MFLEFFLLEDAEGFGRVVGAFHVGGVEDVAELVAGEPIEVRVVGVELGAEDTTAFGIPREWVAVVAQVLGPWAQVFGRVGQLQHPGDDEIEIALGICVRRKHWKLLH